MPNKYQPTTCPHCGQTTTYSSSINKGLVYTLVALLAAVKSKANRGEAKPNDIHLRNEIEISNEEAKKAGGIQFVAYQGRMTHSMIDNIRHLRGHGLVAFSGDKGAGRFLVTKKGANFLRGKYPIKKTAILSTVDGNTAGYYDADGEVTLEQVLKHDPKDIAPFWWNDEYGKLLTKIAEPDASGPQAKLFG